MLGENLRRFLTTDRFERTNNSALSRFDRASNKIAVRVVPKYRTACNNV